MDGKGFWAYMFVAAPEIGTSINDPAIGMVAQDRGLQGGNGKAERAKVR